MSQLEHIEAIEKHLWSAADNLRANSNYASNENFQPVHGELPVTRRIRSAVFLECTFFGRSSAFQHGRVQFRC